MKKNLIVFLQYLIFPIFMLVSSVCLLWGAFFYFPKYTIAGIVFLIILGTWKYWLVRRKNTQRGWRAVVSGLGMIYYAELKNGKWEKIEIDGERLLGIPRHVIYIGSPEKWSNYPEWAKNRRGEIVSRLKSEFREPQYKYLE